MLKKIFYIDCFFYFFYKIQEEKNYNQIKLISLYYKTKKKYK